MFSNLVDVNNLPCIEFPVSIKKIYRQHKSWGPVSQRQSYNVLLNFLTFINGIVHAFIEEVRRQWALLSHDVRKTLSNFGMHLSV